MENTKFKEGFQKIAISNLSAAGYGMIPPALGIIGTLGGSTFAAKATSKVLSPLQKLIGERSLPVNMAALLGGGALLGIGGKHVYDHLIGDEDEPVQELGDMIDEKTASIYGADFDRGFQKTALIGTLARAAGKVTGFTRNAVKATGGSIKNNVRGLKEHVTRNFKAGVDGKPGTSFKDSRAIAKAKATRDANKSQAMAKNEIKAINQSAQPPKQPKPVKEKKSPAPKTETGKGLSDETKKRIAVGAAGVGGGYYLSNQSEPTQANTGYVQ